MALDRITLESVTAQLPPRAVSGHKTTFGHVVIVAGSPNTPGAAILCALGALRSGAGLVHWACEREVVQMAPARPPEVMLALREHVPNASDAEVWAEHLLSLGQSLVIGPGLSQSPQAQAVVEALLKRARKPACLDADALNILANKPALWPPMPALCVLTPHPKEMARLCGTSVEKVLEAPQQAARQLAERTGCVVVLKAVATTVSAPDGRVVQTADEGISALGHGGTGDVLAGLVGGLLAQGVEPYLAAQTAVVVHRAAGAHAAALCGHAGTAASDVAHALGAVWALCGR